MKKSGIIISAALLLAFSLTSCSSRDSSSPNESNKSSYSGSEDTKDNKPEKERVSKPVQKTDYYSLLDESSKNQINIITQKLPELIGDYSYIFIADLDGNGRSELILSDPGFVIYEISEDQHSLVQTVLIQDDAPSLYPVTDKLICTDGEGKRHYIWKSVKDESTSEVRESEKEYMYENGTLTSKVLRSKIFDKYTGKYTSYCNPEGAADYAGYSGAVSGLLFNQGYRLMQSSIGILTASDINNADAETLKQLLSELKTFFSVTEPKGRYQFKDLEGTWVRNGGFSAGADYFQSSDETSEKLVINGNTYQLSGSLQTEPSRLSFSLGGNINAVLWYAELESNSVIRNASLTVENDGTLRLEGTALNPGGQTMNIEWLFHKEGWEYADDSLISSGIEIPSEGASDQQYGNPEAETVYNENSIQNTEFAPENNAPEISPSVQEPSEAPSAETPDIPDNQIPDAESTADTNDTLF